MRIYMIPHRGAGGKELLKKDCLKKKSICVSRRDPARGKQHGVGRESTEGKLYMWEGIFGRTWLLGVFHRFSLL